MSQKPAVCGPFFRSLGNVGDWPTGWLGREGSNLRMAKSKSAWHPLASAEPQKPRAIAAHWQLRLPVSSLVSLS